MTYGWQQTLLSEEDLVKRAAATIPRMLAHPAITFDQVSRLYGHVDDCIARLANMVADMEIVGADRVWIEAAEAIHGIWKSLALDAAERRQSFGTISLDVRDASTDGSGAPVKTGSGPAAELEC